MMESLFGSYVFKGRMPDKPNCPACGLYLSCKSPKMPFTGRGRKRVLICAESPGFEEDEQGIQLVGKSGRLVRESLEKIDIDLDIDCWKTNANICFPGKGKTATTAQMEACRPNLNNTIKELKPNVIILLGQLALESLIGQHWRKGEDIGTITQWAGFKIPSQKLNAWICPTYHPAYLLRKKLPALQVWFDRHLKEAFSLDGVPWPDGIPNYEKQVECVFDTDKAAHILRKMIEKGGRVAWDLETNMLKPDSDKSKIISCAVCWEGMKTIAYPWSGEAITATSELLLSPEIEKIGANIKFETRWIKVILKHDVVGWIHDDVIAAHIIDNRPGITSVKFQAFVQLGFSPWDDEIVPYLKTDSGYGYEENRIKDCSMEKLLTYNGLDSYVEWNIAKKQMEVL